MNNDVIDNWGVDIYMNPYIYVTDNTIADISTNSYGSPTSTKFTLREAYNATADTPYTRIKMGGSINVGLTAARNLPNVGSSWPININSIILGKPPSIRADEASFEVYCGLLTNYSISGTDTGITWSMNTMLSTTMLIWESGLSNL